MANITTHQVWQEIEDQLFGIIGMTTAKNETRTVGIVYTVHQGKLYFGTNRNEWKTRHMAQNPNVSMTIPIAKRILFLPWVKIPSATITFAAKIRILESGEVPSEVLEAIHEGIKDPSEIGASSVTIEVIPKGDFITYGVGVSMQTMRDTEKARGRAAVA